MLWTWKRSAGTHYNLSMGGIWTWYNTGWVKIQLYSDYGFSLEYSGTDLRTLFGREMISRWNLLAVEE